MRYVWKMERRENNCKSESVASASSDRRVALAVVGGGLPPVEVRSRIDPLHYHTTLMHCLFCGGKMMLSARIDRDQIR